MRAHSNLIEGSVTFHVLAFQYLQAKPPDPKFLSCFHIGILFEKSAQFSLLGSSMIVATQLLPNFTQFSAFEELRDVAGIGSSNLGLQTQEMCYFQVQGTYT